MIKIIKTGIKLALLAIVANATWHLFVAYSAHYKFRDAVEYAAQNRGEKSDFDLHEDIMGLAEQADVPIPPEAVEVTHIGTATEVRVSYSRPLELVPNKQYPWSFSFRINTFTRQAPNTVSPK